MSILVDRSSRVVVQGITGRDGAFHTKQMIAYGTKIVGGVTPGKGGQKTEDGVPIFNTMADAVAATAANTSIIYVPAAFAADAICEAADAGISLVVCITEGVPVRDMVRVLPYIKERGTRLIGPNSPGIISPGQCKVGIMPGAIHKPGPVGIVSRSGTLTYEVVYHLSQAGIGQSTVFGIGGDPVVGTTLLDALELFGKDPGTDVVVLIGEIGGSDEEEAAAIIAGGYPKKVASFIAGRAAPPGKRMGHAGAIVTGGSGTAAEKIAAFEKAGVPVASVPAEIATIVAKMLRAGAAKKPARKPIAKKPAAKKPPGRTAKKAAPKRAAKKAPKKTAKKPARKASGRRR